MTIKIVICKFCLIEVQTSKSNYRKTVYHKCPHGIQCHLIGVKSCGECRKIRDVVYQEEKKEFKKIIVQPFLDELIILYEKYGVTVFSCGRCEEDCVVKSNNEEITEHIEYLRK